MASNKYLRLGAALFGVLLLATAALAESSSMNTFAKTAAGVKPEALSITFTAYYNGDDSKIQTEDSWNDFNNNDGYVATAGVCRVNPIQVAEDQSSQAYNVWVSYIGTEGNQGGGASGTVPTSGTGYTNPGTTGTPLNLASASFLAIPTNISAAAGSGQAYLNWNAVAGATGYRIYKRPASGEGPTEIVFERAAIINDASTGCLISGLTEGTTYNFIIVATDASKRSGHSDEIAVTPTSTNLPVINGPSSGTAGQAITITGNNFGLSQGTVYINNVAATVLSWSNTEISATIDASTPARNGELVVITSSQLMASIPFTVEKAVLNLNPNTLTFVAAQGGSNPSNQTVTISNTGTGTLNWSATKGQSWLTINPASGSCPPNSTMTVSADITGLTAGTYNDTLNFTSNGGSGSVEVTLNVNPPTPSISSIVWKEDNPDNIKNKNFVYGVIEIHGTNFGTDPGDGNRDTSTNKVTISNVVVPDLAAPQAGVMEVYYWDNSNAGDNIIVAGIPLKNEAGSSYIIAGSLPVVVTAGGQNSNPSTIEVRPKVYSVNPTTGQTGTLVSIVGTAFGANPSNISVSFNGTSTPAATAINTTVEVNVPAGATTGQLLVTINGKTSNTNYDWGTNDQIIFTVQKPIVNKTFNLAYLSETQAENWITVPFNSATVNSVPINTIGDLMGSLAGSFTPSAGDIMTLSWYDNGLQVPVFALRDYDGTKWNSWDPDKEANNVKIGGMYIVSISNPGRPVFSGSWTVSGTVPDPGSVNFTLGYQSETQAENWISVPNQTGINSQGDLMASIAGSFTNQAGDIMTLSWYDNTNQVPIFALRDFDGTKWNSWDPDKEALAASLGSPYKISVSNQGRNVFTTTWP